MKRISLNISVDSELSKSELVEAENAAYEAAMRALLMFPGADGRQAIRSAERVDNSA